MGCRRRLIVIRLSVISQSAGVGAGKLSATANSSVGELVIWLRPIDRVRADVHTPNYISLNIKGSSKVAFNDSAIDRLPVSRRESVDLVRTQSWIKRILLEYPKGGSSGSGQADLISFVSIRLISGTLMR